VDGSFAFFLVICALFGIAGGLQGRSKGSSFVLWFFISACLPLFGFLASVVYPGHRHELRRRCDGCGRLLPITDTMCMGCGTDLDFPEVRYRSVAGSVVAVGPDGRELRPDADEDDDASPYERADNPYEQAADAEPDDAPAPAGSGVGPDR
jgi:hypothetical protein